MKPRESQIKLGSAQQVNNIKKYLAEAESNGNAHLPSMKQVIHSLKDIESVPSIPQVDKTNSLGAADNGKAYHTVPGNSSEKVTPVKAKNVNFGSPSKQLAANMISVKGAQNL